MGTNEGIIILDNDKYVIINEKDGLKNLFVRAIYIDKENILWIGTYGGGLYRYDGKNLFSYAKYQEIPKTIHFIIEDGKGKLWMTSNEGVFSLPKEDLDKIAKGREAFLNVIWTNEKDGMLDRECNGGFQPAGFLSKDGFLYIPTVRGIVKVNTNPITDFIPPVEIEEVLLNGKKIPINDNKIEIPYGKNLIEIKTVVLSYLSPKEQKFKCMLDKWDMDFVDMGTRNVAYYSNLKPGNYKFKVIADNGFGLWNEEGAELEINIPAPFTHTIYFYILLSLLALGLIIFSVYFYTYSLRKRKEKLEKIVEKETTKIKGLSELASRTNYFSSLNELMDFFYENFKNIISYRFLALLILKEKTTKIIWAKLGSIEEDILKDVEIEEKVFNSESPILIKDIYGENLFFKYLEEKGLKSLMVFPLKYNLEPFGYLIFGSDIYKDYSKEDIETFEDISVQISSSIKKTYLLEELQNIAGLSDRFYSIILHDLKHPINTISLYIELLKDDIENLNNVQREYLLSMDKTIKDYNLLLGDLLDLALFRGKYLETKVERKDFVSFLKEINIEMERRARARGFFWNSFLPDFEVPLNFDPKRIKQVIENFVSNALKYAPPNTTLTFGLEVFEKEVKVYLRDEGVLSEEKKKLIENVLSSSYEPKAFISKVGLGLYISRIILESHGGKIYFESNFSGGCTFYFILPK